MGFFRDSESRSWGSGIEIFYCGVDRKMGIGIFQIRGSGFKNPKRKIPKSPKSSKFGLKLEIFNGNFKYFLKIEKIVGFYDFLCIRIFSGFSENPRDFSQIPGIRVYSVTGFYSRDSGFFLVSGFFPGIRGFS